MRGGNGAPADPQSVSRCEQEALDLGNARLSSALMTSRTFLIPAAKGKSFKTINAIDVAARYFV
jgi:hypothetical protein